MICSVVTENLLMCGKTDEKVNSKNEITVAFTNTVKHIIYINNSPLALRSQGFLMGWRLLILHKG